MLTIDFQLQGGATAMIASDLLSVRMRDFERFTPGQRVDVLAASMGKQARLILPAREPVPLALLPSIG